MRIVQVNKTLPPISEGLRELGHEVVKVDSKLREDAIVRLVIDARPDLVIFHKCNDKSPEMTRSLARKFLTWFWMPDLFLVVRSPEAERNIVGNARNCHYRSAPSNLHRNQLAKKTGMEVHMVHNVVAPEYRPIPNVTQDYDFGFLGLRTKYRNKMMTEIMPKGSSILLHGGGYPLGKVAGKDYAMAVCRTKIQFNLAQEEKWPGILSSRSYRILASGGFMLAQHSKDFLGILDRDVHFAGFDTVDEAKEKAAYYLNHDKERKEMAERGRWWVMDHFLPIHSARKMMEILEGG